MKHKQTAIILIICAALFALGAYLLLADSSDDTTSEHRAEVAPPEPGEFTAPAWVGKGQNAQPDYSSSTADAQNATPVPVKKAEKTEKSNIIEVSEDKVITFTFVESLADFLLHRFQPKSSKGKPATAASAKALNMYYGRELDGFVVSGDDIRLSRKAVLDYAFTPTMIRALYALYEPVFMAHLVDTAETDEREYKINGDTERRTLEKAEIVAMLRLNARKIEQTAQIFRAIGTDPTITKSIGKYLRAAKAVERANLQLQITMADDKDATKASQRLKQAILQRERVKTETVATLSRACPACPKSDLFYLAQWAYRRILNEPDKRLESFEVAAEVLDDLAAKFRAQANELQE